MPENGLINTLEISLSNFRKMKTLLGDEFDMSRFSDEVIIV